MFVITACTLMCHSLHLAVCSLTVQVIFFAHKVMVVGDNIDVTL